VEVNISNSEHSIICTVKCNGKIDSVINSCVGIVKEYSQKLVNIDQMMENWEKDISEAGLIISSEEQYNILELKERLNKSKLLEQQDIVLKSLPQSKIMKSRKVKRLMVQFESILEDYKKAWLNYRKLEYVFRSKYYFSLMRINNDWTFNDQLLHNDPMYRKGCGARDMLNFAKSDVEEFIKKNRKFIGKSKIILNSAKEIDRILRYCKSTIKKKVDEEELTVEEVVNKYRNIFINYLKAQKRYVDTYENIFN